MFKIITLLLLGFFVSVFPSNVFSQGIGSAPAPRFDDGGIDVGVDSKPAQKVDDGGIVVGSACPSIYIASCQNDKTGNECVTQLKKVIAQYPKCGFENLLESQTQTRPAQKFDDGGIDTSSQTKPAQKFDDGGIDVSVGTKPAQKFDDGGIDVGAASSKMISPNTNTETVIIPASDGPASATIPSEAVTKKITIDSKTVSDKVTISITDITSEAKPISAETTETIETKGDKIFLQNKEVKVMPDVVSRIAIERLDTLDFKIELKNVGNENDSKPVYEAVTKKNVRRLGLFKNTMTMKVTVDGENSTSVRVQKPWWSFIAF